MQIGLHYLKCIFEKVFKLNNEFHIYTFGRNWVGF